MQFDIYVHNGKNPINSYYLLITMLKKSMLLFKFKFSFLLILQNQRTTSKKTHGALNMMKLVLFVALISILGVFAQNGETPDDLSMMPSCYPRCLDAFNKCRTYYNCYGRPSSEQNRCLDYCRDQYNKCIKC